MLEQTAQSVVMFAIAMTSQAINFDPLGLWTLDEEALRSLQTVGFGLSVRRRRHTGILAKL